MVKRLSRLDVDPLDILIILYELTLDNCGVRGGGHKIARKPIEPACYAKKAACHPPIPGTASS